MTPLYNIRRLMMGIALLTTSVTADDSFPYADLTFLDDELQLWTLERVSDQRDRTIGFFNADDSVMIKDNAATPYLIAYMSRYKEGISDKAEKENEKNGIVDPNAVIFKTELDLTKLNGLVNFAIHVDDIATLNVTEKLNGTEPIGYSPITETYHVNGTALWRLDHSYKEFTTPIPAGRKYDLKLNYQNTANLTDKYDGPIDHDGVNVFLMHQPVLDLTIASYGNEKNLPEDRQPNGNSSPTPHEMDPGAVVIAPIAGSDGEGITPGKRARLTLTCDGSQPADGAYTLSADPALTKLKIYDKEEGGDPINLPKQWPAKNFTSATKTYYVGSEAFNPEDKIESGTLTLTYQRPAEAEGTKDELKDQVKVTLTPIEVVELAPLVRDEDGNPIPESAKPNLGKPLSPFVEEDPYTNRIAHREIKVRVGSPAISGKKVKWTLVELPGATPASIRGKWPDSPVKAHKNAFEESVAYGKNGFEISGVGKDAVAVTTVGTDGHTAIRVNVPPIGFNQVRIKIQVEGIEEPLNLIDMEVPAVVVIDAGHGTGRGTINGSNSIGTTAPISRTQEHEAALDILTLLVDHMRNKYKIVHNVRVLKARSSAANVGFTARTSVAKNNGADVFISLHFNHPGNNKAGDPLTITRRNPFYLVDNTDNVNREEDMLLGLNIRTSVQKAINACESQQGKDYLTDGLTSETHEINLNKLGIDGKDVLTDEDEQNQGYTVEGLGNSSDYHPCRATIIELEWFSHPAADALFNIKSAKKINNIFGRHTEIREQLINYIPDAIVNNILNHK